MFTTVTEVNMQTISLKIGRNAQQHLMCHFARLLMRSLTVQKLKTSPHKRKEQWDREDFVNLCVHTFSGDTDSLAVALCDAVAPDESEWEVSDSIMAYIMCCLEMAEMKYEDPDEQDA